MMRPKFRNRYLVGFDAILLGALPALAYLIRFEGPDWSPADAGALIAFTLIAVPLKLALFVLGGMYNRLWRQATLGDMTSILRTAAVSAVGATILGFWLPLAGIADVRVPVSVLAFDALATVAVLAAPRLLLKSLYTPSRGLRRDTDPAALIVGAGVAGESIAKETLANPKLGLRLVGFVDDDPDKRSLRLCGLPVLGSLDEIPALIERYHVRELIIAMPEARGSVVRGVVKAARAAGVHTRTVPGVYEILSEQVSLSALREVGIQDLLRREPVTTDLTSVREVFAGGTVLVTGAGGSIGSELCRQIARLEPARVLLLGHGENSIFEIQTALREANPELETVALIADVRDGGRIREIVRTWRPRVILHAAAHKHVPLMEQNVSEAILNNVLGTANVVAAAVEAETEHLVCVSTDKAVRPCSVMGLTKRVAELVVQQAAIEHGRNFVSVRFGNVLGSRGSVVPAFLRQIKAGGPVTVTHPEMRRYFMTVPEAAQLILQAGTLGRCGEVFVLDMGEPVRIVDLAGDLIRLSGLEPGSDIEIRFTGLRPGERLHEEVLIAGESVVPTPHPKVLRAINGELPAGVSARLCVLIAAAEQRQPEPVLRALLTAMVPEATRSDDALGALPAVGHGNGNGHVSGNGNGNGNGSHPAGVAGTGAGDADGAPSRRPPHRSIPSTP
jgi:FlaA1/EpsC-like NDP-sugar epimerase